MEITLGDIIPFLSERGRVEVDLAIARLGNAKLAEENRLLKDALGDGQAQPA